VGGGVRTVDDGASPLRQRPDQPTRPFSQVIREPLLPVRAPQNIVVAVASGAFGRTLVQGAGWDISIAGGRKNTGLVAVAWSHRITQRSAGGA
jgi:imidazole glycerol phosphate synthase subunit HisF